MALDNNSKAPGQSAKVVPVSVALATTSSSNNNNNTAAVATPTWSAPPATKASRTSRSSRSSRTSRSSRSSKTARSSKSSKSSRVSTRSKRKDKDADGESIQPLPIRSIVFDGSLGLQEYEELPRPWAHNGIKTSKYTWWNFLPKNLFEQFRKMANLYFLVMVILMVIGQTGILFRSSLTYISTLGPLVLVMGFTMAMEIKDDCFRHKQDHIINKERKASVVINGTVQHIPWQDVRVGQLLLVRNKEEIPADLVLLSSSKVEGISYVETSNIDGETNLKLKLSVPDAYALISKGHEGSLKTAINQASNLQGVLVFEAPNSSIRTFNASIEGAHLKDGAASTTPEYRQLRPGDFQTCEAAERAKPSVDACPVGAGNLLLRGSKIRNTPWVLGMVVYTGEETKVMMNSRSTRTKLSTINRTVNMTLVAVFICMLVLTAVSVAVTHVFRSSQGWDGYEYENMWYIKNPDIVGYGTTSTTALLSGPYLSWLGDFLTYFVLYNNFIPISLYVTLEICNFCQAMWINNDERMYYAPVETAALVRSSALCQELGQVEYIFSDKTGTLTRNEMKLKRFALCGSGTEFNLTEGTREIVAATLAGKSPGATSSEADDDGKSRSSTSIPRAVSSKADADLLRMMLTIMAVAHTVVIEEDVQAAESEDAVENEDDVQPGVADGNQTQVKPDVPATTGLDTFNAESPDEGALVSAARELGFRFMERNFDAVTVEMPADVDNEKFMPMDTTGGDGGDGSDGSDPAVKESIFKVLAINQFSSARKRMSVLCKTHDGRYLLLVKGADNVMVQIAAPGQGAALERLQHQLSGYAREGLRTLVFGYAEITEAQCQRWMTTHDAAANAMVDRKGQLAEAAASIECNLTIVGATAIEDKLQRGVPSAIADLQAAGIKLWVLTGDKMETAINIGFSSNVLTPAMVILQLDVKPGLSDLEQTKRLRHQFVHIQREAAKPRPGQREGEAGATTTSPIDGSHALKQVSSETQLATVVTGGALSVIMEDEDLKARFLQLGRQCKVVIACRVSPLQKSEIVRLVRYNIAPNPITLAIGDGANDVGMIQEAHVGVGISGKEGLQAVNNSDFAIAQFAFLRRLLLVHGRWNYRRVCKVILYSFYKNIAFVFVAFFYNFFSGWSGMSLYEGLMGSQYNLILALPIIATGVFDKDVQQETILDHPGLYISGRFNLDLNIAQMVKTIFLAIFHAAIVFTVPCVTFYGNVSSATTLPVFGMIVMTCLIITMQYRVFFLTATWNWLTWVFWFGSFALYIAFIFSYSNITWLGYRSYRAAEEMCMNPLFWVVVAGVPLCAIVLDVFGEYLRREFYPNPIDISLELESLLKKGAPLASTDSGGGQRRRSQRKRESAQSTLKKSGTAGRNGRPIQPVPARTASLIKIASDTSRNAILSSYTKEIQKVAEQKLREQDDQASKLLEKAPGVNSDKDLLHASTIKVIPAYEHGAGFDFSAIDSESEESYDSYWSSGSESDSDNVEPKAIVGNGQSDRRHHDTHHTHHHSGHHRLSDGTPASDQRLRTRLSTRMKSTLEYSLTQELRNAESAGTKSASNKTDSLSIIVAPDSRPKKKKRFSATPKSSAFSESLTAVGSAASGKRTPLRGKTTVRLPPTHTSRAGDPSDARKLKQKRRKKRKGVNREPICQQALAAWQPHYNPMVYFASTLLATVIFTVFAALLLNANEEYVEYYVQIDGPPHNPFRNTVWDGFDHNSIEKFQWNITDDVDATGFDEADVERLVEEWQEDPVYPKHHYSYQPCPLHGTMRNSHEATHTCHVAVYIATAIPGEVAVNYRLSNFFYSILGFALSWNPLALMAEPGYTYEYVNRSGLSEEELLEAHSAVAEKVQLSSSDGSCSNAALNADTGRLLEPCGLRAAAMFNDKFTLRNFSVHNISSRRRQLRSLQEPMLRGLGPVSRRRRLATCAESLQDVGGGQFAEWIDETGIAWQSDTNVMVNSERVVNGSFADGVSYLHDQQPHLVKPSEGINNEHFMVWMHSEAFPAFNKRYGFIHCEVEEGSLFVFEVESHFPTTQFGGGKYLHLSSVDSLQVKNKFTPYVFVVAASLCAVLSAFILIEKLACERPAGQAEFNREWYNKALVEYTKKNALKKTTTLSVKNFDDALGEGDEEEEDPAFVEDATQ